MSSRNFRKLTGDSNTLPPPDDDEEYEPIYARNVKNNFTFLGVEEQPSQSEKENNSDSDETGMTACAIVKKNKKKKKQRKNKTQKHHVLNDNLEDLDEIDKSLLEVNALLGPAPPAPVVLPPPPPDPRLKIMAVHPKYLNAAEEMNRLFGPDEDEPKKRGRQNQNQWLKRTIILPDIEERRAIHFVNGLTMSLNRRENDLLYFTYDHNKEIQKLHQMLLLGRMGRWGTTNVMPQSLDDPTNAHVEGLIDTIDVLFAFEQYSVTKVLVEQALTHMQRVADNLFNITNPKVRLEYKFRENRAFHILVFKYLYLVSNRACHRTALELAKVLMNLDPSDPLAVLLIIDTLALRAREHQWLIEAVEYWTKERKADFLFNIQYSNAMAHFHVIKKKKGDLTEADKLIQTAILGYPTLAIKLYECCSVNIEPRIRDHPLFKETNINNNLEDLMVLYAKLSWSRWKEPPVLNWLKRNVDEVIEKYQNSVGVQESVKKFKNKRLNLFQVWPKEIIRHLSIIKPMAQLLVDGAVPDVGRHCPFNPCPPADGVDRYKYDGPPPYGAHRDTSNMFYDLLNSMMPTHNPYVLPDFDDDADDDDDEPVVVRNVRRHEPRPHEFDAELEANLQLIIEMSSDNNDPRNNNLMNSAGEVRNAFIQLLGELFENIYLNEMENRLTLRRRERTAMRERGEARARDEQRQTAENAQAEETQKENTKEIDETQENNELKENNEVRERDDLTEVYDFKQTNKAEEKGEIEEKDAAKESAESQQEEDVKENDEPEDRDSLKQRNETGKDEDVDEKNDINIIDGSSENAKIGTDEDIKTIEKGENIELKEKDEISTKEIGGNEN